MSEPADTLSDRALRIFGDVRPGEAGVALLQLANLFLLLVGYYILKTVREPLILATGGAEMKSYAAAAQALVLMGFIPLYSWLAAHVDRGQLVTWLLLFFIANVELFNLGLRVGVRNLGFVFYVWVGIFSLATIAQFWSVANDIYSRPDGERLFPLIGIGATAGSPVGSKAASLLFDAGMKPQDMLHITAALLLVHLSLYLVVSARLQRRGGEPRRPQPLAGPGGFALVFRSRYLRLIAVLLVLLNVVNTIGEYVVSKSVLAAANAAHAADLALDVSAYIGSFYGDYFFWVNVAAVLLQAFFVARLVKLAGIAGVLLLLPLVSLGAYTLIGSGVAFGVLRWAKTAENATDYSVMNTGRQMLWLPTTPEEKYKAKQALDTFFVRTGDMLAAGVVFAGTSWFGLTIAGFAWANVALVLLWLVVAVLLVRQNTRLSQSIKSA
ncbi:MAG TPA: translocase [Chloroflexota bacterium]|nr:translocase [Chloroflexota bacterium]